MIDRVADRVGSYVDLHPVALILVDIVVNETQGALPDRGGFDIAGELRRRRPDVPICLITSHHTLEPGASIVTEASLQPFEGVIIKSYLDGDFFSAKRLRSLIQSASARLAATRPPASPMPTPRAELERIHNVVDERTLDPRVEKQIRALGEDRFWGLLAQLLPKADSATLSFLKPGRSAAGVFSLRFQNRFSDGFQSTPIAAVLKVSTEHSKLANEAENYRVLQASALSSRSFPRMHGSEVWMSSIGGFVIELDPQTLSLSEFIHRSLADADRVSTLATSLCTALAALHGEPRAKLTVPWKTYYALDDDLRISTLAFLTDNEGLFGTVGLGESAKQVREFVMTNGEIESTLVGYQRRVREVRAHGDLNAGNLLVSQNGEVSLIDFEHTGPHHAATDFAKLERDLFFRVQDYGTPAYYDWLPLGVAGCAARNEATTDAFEPLTFLRSTLRTGATEGDRNVPLPEYLMALLRHSISALANEALPLPRRAAGLEYVAELRRMTREAIAAD